MTDIGTLAEELSTETLGFLLSIQTVKKIDADAFQRIDQLTRQLAKLLKPQSLVPKNLLHEIRSTTKILRAEAPYINKGNNPLNAMADKLEMTFDLILLGESHEDRVPGVPRII